LSQAVASGQSPTQDLRTEVVRGAERVTTELFLAVERATSTISTYAEPSGPKLLFEVESYRKLLLASTARGVKLRYITEVTKDNVAYCKRMVEEFGAEIRHTDSVIGNFSVTEKELVLTASRMKAGEIIPELIYSNVPELVEHIAHLFENLWQRAVPAQIRFIELETGEKHGNTRVTYSTQDILSSAQKFVEEMKVEALIILTEGNSLTRNMPMFRKIVEKIKTDGAEVKILGRFSAEEAKIVDEFRSNGAEIRGLGISKISNMALGIYDRRMMGLAQYLYPSSQKNPDPESIALSGIISTEERIVAGIAAIFDALWEESDLREAQERSYRQSSLLQDILSHDIRNYNQVMKLSAELLQEELKQDQTVASLIENLLNAIDGSTALLQRIKGFGKILSEENPVLYPVDLKKAIAESLALIKASHHDKAVECSEFYPPDEEDLRVKADDILSEAFSNLFSNAVKYTAGRDVKIKIQVSPNEATIRQVRKTYWKITITDEGMGIPDELKPRIFERYLSGARGSGLGMSIVHALVVERYKGALQIRNRVPDDYSKGTVVEILLPKA
jgi:two-component system sensor histidine kinase VicK